MPVEFGLDPQILQKIKAVFSKFPAIEEVVLYGSRAKGNYQKGSDIDIALKGERLNHQTLKEVVLQLDDLLLPYTFDISLLQQISNPDLIDHIKRLGKTVYAKNSQSKTNSPH